MKMGIGGELWTGGYDDMIRIWDLRMLKRCVAEVGVGGGVWRIGFHEEMCGVAVVAAMYGGFKVVGRGKGGGLEVRAGYDGHDGDGIGYGACWVPGVERREGEEVERVAVTGSFYDRSLQLWTFWGQDDERGD